MTHPGSRDPDARRRTNPVASLPESLQDQPRQCGAPPEVPGRLRGSEPAPTERCLPGLKMPPEMPAARRPARTTVDYRAKRGLPPRDQPGPAPPRRCLPGSPREVKRTRASPDRAVPPWSPECPQRRLQPGVQPGQPVGYVANRSLPPREQPRPASPRRCLPGSLGEVKGTRASPDKAVPLWPPECPRKHPQPTLEVPPQR